jgi:outer membrane protein assembly factor BamE
MSAFSRAALPLILVLGFALGSAGCVYRPNIQQGNLLKTEDIDQVTVGMTRSQVRYLLGTPMLANPFDPQRWDYIYTLRRGRDKNWDRAHFIVRFDGDKVSGIEKPDMPSPTKPDLPPQKAQAPAVAPAADAAPLPPPPSATEQLPGAPTPAGTNP